MGYLATSKTITVRNYSYDGVSWAQISVVISVTAAGAVTAKMTATHHDAGWMCKGLIVKVNDTTLFSNNYVSATSECIKDDSGVSGKFPYYSGYTCTKSAGTVSGSTVSYDIRIDCMSDGNAHGWSGGEEKSYADGGKKNNYKGTTKASSFARDSYTEASAGTFTFTDTYDNGFKVTANKGTGNSSNNTTGLKDRKWGYSTTTRTTAFTDGTRNAIATSGTANTRTVYVEATTTQTYGSDKKGTDSFAVRQYKAPNKPKNLTIASSSYKNGRLTIKQDWTFTWTASTPGTGTGTTNGTDSNQTTSKVKGYKITIQKKTGSGSFAAIAIKNSSGTTITDSSHNYYANVTSLTFSPLKSDILPGDQVKIIVKPYTQYGRNNDGDYLYGTEESYTTITVQNAGVMRVKAKTGGTTSNPVYNWREGVVWVKVNKGTAAKPNIQWVEADIVKTKVGNNWRESQ